VENARKYLPLIIGGIVAILVFFISRKMRKSNEANSERSTILEKAREAKMTKSILKNITDDSQSTTN
jgi:phosphate/sulfate permease